MRSSPKAPCASRRAPSSARANSALALTMRMPRPPPPADALIITGKPILSASAMGSKAAAKALMEAHGVPVVSRYHGEGQDDARLLAEADRIGFPVLIKALSRGGGPGKA